jgi:rSAM/selenodomain-associated transferase 1
MADEGSATGRRSPAAASAGGNTLLVQFARSPLAGSVKTRMIPALTPEQACELHCELLAWTCHHLLAAQLGPVELQVAGDLDHPVLQRCRDAGLRRILPQAGAGLGERMFHALDSGLQHFERVLLVGSDCPWIDGEYLRAASAALDHASVVLGPALDGGYVLIGARRIDAEVFREIPWGSDVVYARTVARLEKLGWEWAALPALQDIDRPQDLAAWHRLRERSRRAGS